MSQLLWNIPVFASFVLLFSGTLAWIWGNWFNYQGSHGPVILAISLYMVWKKRGELAGLEARPSLAIGVPALIAGCMMLIMGRVSSILLLEYVSVVAVLLGLVLALFGRAYLKALWLPIAYLLFMFPVFSEALEGISIHLQDATAWIAFQILDLGGVAVSKSSQFLKLPHLTLEVARECNGINHIVSLVSLAVPLAWWTQRTWAKRAILIAAAFFTGIVANGLRVAIIGFLSVYNPGGPVHGPYDIFYVSFIFFFGMAILSFIALLMSKTGTGPAAEEAGTVRRPGLRQRRISPGAFVIAALIMASSGGYLFFFKAKPVELQYPLAMFPYKIGGWKGHDAPLADEPFKYFSADAELKRKYTDEAGHEVRLYIGYFLMQGQDREVVNYRFDPLHSGASEITIPVDGAEALRINTSRTRAGLNAYFWYEINGRVLTDRYSAKLSTVYGGLLSRRTNGAIVVVAADEGVDGAGFIKAALPAIKTFLNTEG